MSFELGGRDTWAMFFESSTLGSQKPLYIVTQTAVEGGENLGTICVEHTSLICAVSMLLFNLMGKTDMQLPNSEKIGEASWMPSVPLAAKADPRSKVRVLLSDVQG